MLFRLYCRLVQGVFRMVMPLLPWREPELTQDPGCVTTLPGTIANAGVSRVLVVTDRGISALGILDPLLAALGEAGIFYRVYDGTSANPTVDNVEEALTLYRQERCHGLLAAGGGSPIDCAKGVGIRAVRPRRSLASLKGVLKVRRPLPPLFIVPTTAGTGSEVTLAAVISSPERHEKCVIMDPALIPHYAVLDGEVTTGLPADLTATTGMDALTHAIEAFIGGSNTPRTEEDAVTATALIFEYLPRAFENGLDLEARQQMLRASYLAGRAFTRAYVGNVHAIAHTLGGFYNVPHGLANAIILPHVLEYYGDSITARLTELSLRARIAPDGAAFLERIRSMNRQLGISEFVGGVDPADVPLMARRAHRESNPLYPVPRIFSVEDFRTLYRIITNDFSDRTSPAPRSDR